MSKKISLFNFRFNNSKQLDAEALAAQAQGDWANALARWETCIARYNADVKPSWYAGKAKALLQLGRLDEAEVLYRKLSEEQPDSHLGFDGLAQVAQWKEDWETALTRWELCLKRFPESAQPWWFSEQARALLHSRRYDDAEVLYRNLSEEQPNSHVGFDGLAQVAQWRQDWETALTRWELCLKRFPEDAQPWWYAAQAYALLQSGRLDEAEKLYGKLSQEQPDSHEGFCGLAQIAQKRADWASALSHWEVCIEKSPDGTEPWWHSSKGDVLLELGQLDEAKCVFERLTETHPSHHSGWEGLAKVTFLLEDLHLSLSYATRLIKDHPEQRSGYHWAEESLINLGRFDEAAKINLSCPPPASTARPNQFPEGFPDDLNIPPLVGEGNDYGFIEEKVTHFEKSKVGYHLPVSIIIPVYNRAIILAKTLAALVHQTYPRELMEIVIADGGSTEPLDEVLHKYEPYFAMKYVRQEDLGYRLAAVRNLGISAAQYGHIILLDCDVLPVPGFVEAYMKYTHVTDRVALFGLRRHVCTDLLTDDQILQDINLALGLPDIDPNNAVSDWQTSGGQSFDWRLPLLAKTKDLKSDRFPCKAFAGGNVAFPKAAYDCVGGFDERFQDWGGEDMEFAFRLYNAGYYFIPVRDALGLHQEPIGGENELDRSAGHQKTRILLEEKCSIPGFRQYEQGRQYEVPKVSIYMPAHNAGLYIKEAIDSALKQTYTDLEIVICDDGSTDNTLNVIQNNYRDDPRVRWVSQPKGGIASASNTAVRLCRGMYIGQLDADDILKPHAVEWAVDYLDSHDVGIVYGREERIDDSGKIRRLTPSSSFSREWMLISMRMTHFRMFRKRDWMRTDGFDETLENAVDYDMFQKLSEVCSVGHFPVLTYSYRWHGQNTSIVKRRIQEKNHLLVIQRALDRLGLGDEWEAIMGTRVEARQVTIRRKRPNAIL